MSVSIATEAAGNSISSTCYAWSSAIQTSISSLIIQIKHYANLFFTFAYQYCSQIKLPSIVQIKSVLTRDVCIAVFSGMLIMKMIQTISNKIWKHHSV